MSNIDGIRRLAVNRSNPLRRTRMRPGKPSRTPMPPEVAEAVLERANGVCEACRFSSGGRLELHHRKMRSQGGKHTVENLIHVHSECHNVIHGQPDISYRLGLLVRSWLDPADVPVKPFGSLTIWAEQ
jgi:5-methylcytosine-specific restriction endonuclease McrA